MESYILFTIIGLIVGLGMNRGPHRDHADGGTFLIFGVIGAFAGGLSVANMVGDTAFLPWGAFGAALVGAVVVTAALSLATRKRHLI